MSAPSEHDVARMTEILTEAEGSWFTAELLRLMAKADPDNRWRLGLGFPEVVKAYEDWMAGGGGGWASLPDSSGVPIANVRVTGTADERVRVELLPERGDVEHVPIVVSLPAAEVDAFACSLYREAIAIFERRVADRARERTEHEIGPGAL